MKKALLLLLVSVFTLAAYSQNSADDLYYKGIETYRDLQLTSDQLAKIKRLKRDAGSRFEAIGRDRSISGYEKGVRKERLALQLKQDIENVLTKQQISTWESKHGKFVSMENVKEAVKDSYEQKLDDLDYQYKRDEARIENNYNLSHDERKAQKKALKDKYKYDKKRLKDAKKSAKESMF